RSVGPTIGQRLETGASLGNVIEDIKQIAGRPREPIEPSHQQYVTLAKSRDGFPERSPVGLRARCCFSVHLGGTSGMKGSVLGRQGLPVRRHPRIAINGHGYTSLLCMTYAQNIARFFNVKIFERKL